MDTDCTLSIAAASLQECIGIMSCCCDVRAITTPDIAQCKERQVNQWGVRSIQLNQLICARDSDLIGFLHSCKEVSTLTCTVRSRADTLTHSVSEADKRCCAFEACLGALFDTDCWSLCKVVVQTSWTTGSTVVCPDGAAATRRTTTAAVDGVFYPVGKSRALLIVDNNGVGISPGNTRLAVPPPPHKPFCRSVM